MLLTLLALGTSARADETAGQQPVVVVMDFSGSMNADDADEQGTTRIAAAKTAVKGLLAEAPDGARLGLVAYGANNDSCSDIETLNPVGDFDAAKLGGTIDALEAKGNTPIGPALEHAAKELDGIEGPRAVVLVSDGEPNCEPPPACEVAQQLADQGIDLTVHTIGFKIGGNAKAQDTLQCIAQVTGGTYTDVENGGELAEALETEAARAMEGYRADGIRVDGGTSVPEAEGIVAGAHLPKMRGGDKVEETPRLDAQDNTRFFTVPLHEGWTTTLRATLVPPAMASGSEAKGTRQLTIFAPGADGSFCTGKVDRSFQSGYLDHGALTVGLEIAPGDIHERCLTPDGEMVVGVGRFGELWAEQELDVELVVGYRKSDESAFGAVKDPGAAPEMTDAEPTEVAGGTSFSTATELQPGQAIRDDVRGQESRYFKVPVELGQNLEAKVSFDGSPKTSAVALNVFNPLRERLVFEQGPHTHGNGWLAAVFSDMSSSTGMSMEAPLRHALLPENVLGDGDQRAHSVGGMQYLVVSRSWHDGGDDPISYTLQTEVWGEAASAEGIQTLVTPEEYEAEFGAAEPTPSPSPTPSEEPSPEPSEEPTTAESTAAASPTEEPAEDTDQTVTASNRWLQFGLVTAGLLLLVGGGVWWWLRRR